jgi:hypothetical protein
MLLKMRISMKKQLLIATLATAFSAVTFAQDTPAFNHVEALQNLIQYGETGKCPTMTKKLPKFKAILDEGQKRLNEAGAFNWTQEEMTKIEKYSKGHTPKIEDLASGTSTQTPTADSSDSANTQKENTEESSKQ